MQTLEPTTKPSPRRFGETTDAPTEPKRPGATLQTEKPRLLELQRQATARGIQFPAIERPTLWKVQTEITLLERQLASAGSPPGVTLSPKIGVGRAPKSAEGSVSARAREFLARPTPPAFIASPTKPTTTQAIVAIADPRDMGKMELEKAIGLEKDVERRGLLFRELMARERGRPTREVAEIGATSTRTELEQMIQNETNVERRAMLFRELCRRSKN